MFREGLSEEQTEMIVDLFATHVLVSALSENDKGA
jgi:hypothetical protein